MSFVTAKSRFTRLDAFTKTVDEARIRTTSGGVVTIVSLLVVVFLAWGEWADYRRVVIHPELIVDKGRGMCTDTLICAAFIANAVEGWRIDGRGSR